MRALMLALLLLPPAATAESLVAARTIRPQSVVSADDLTVTAARIPGALSDPDAAIGQEARVAIYAGRPVLASALAPPALVARNQVVELVFLTDRLTIRAEGRALGRAAAGERLRVMNLASRTTVTGRVLPDGRVAVDANN
ncbi:MAG: flagellar basal body P-ring formation chaperone FlgA [Gemmobacter sp.]